MRIPAKPISIPGGSIVIHPDEESLAIALRTLSSHRHFERKALSVRNPESHQSTTYRSGCSIGSLGGVHVFDGGIRPGRINFDRAFDVVPAAIRGDVVIRIRLARQTGSRTCSLGGAL